MLHEWSKIREKELYFYRELAGLQKLKKDKEHSTGCSKKVELSVNNKIAITNKEIKKVDSIEYAIENTKSISEEEQ